MIVVWGIYRMVKKNTGVSRTKVKFITKKIMREFKGNKYLGTQKEALDNWWDSLRLGQKYRIHKSETEEN